jgi:hypothetical protein
MLAPRKRWSVTRHVFQGVPFRLEVPPADMKLLELSYLEFVRVPRHWRDINAHLEEMTDCPLVLVNALRMTVHERLFLGARSGRGGRLVDSLGDGLEQMTDLGATWVQSESDRCGVPG